MQRVVEGKVTIKGEIPVTAVAAYLEATGLRQEDVAKNIRVHRNTIGSIAAGGVCRTATAESLAAYTGLPYDLIYSSRKRTIWVLEVQRHKVKVLDDTDGAAAA